MVINVFVTKQFEKKILLNLIQICHVGTDALSLCPACTNHCLNNLKGCIKWGRILKIIVSK